jgi:UDP-N-acetylglucosamine--N-acetylmuramyl-(pentapeptide) pyrophosphoryl-undecaprenol N-acetylglucosamine transferase
LFPAIAVAQALSRNAPDTQLLYVGRRGGIEEQVIPRYRIPMALIVAAKLDMEDVWRNWSVPFVLPRALFQAARIVRRYRPDVVLGTGGYVSVPLILTAAGMRVPVVLQEQNALPGRATRLLSRVARVVATSDPDSAAFLHTKTVVTGTPVRAEFTQPKASFPPRPRSLLVLGGSQGARRINQAVADALPELLRRPDVSVVHQTGAADLEPMRARLAGLPAEAANRYEPLAFVDDLAPRIRAAELVISRAGASTLSEVSAVGIPMLLVPYPYAGGHQRLNVQRFVEAGAARTLSDAECDGPRMLAEITTLIEDPARYSKMVDAMRSLGRPRAADDVARLLQEAAEGR